MKRILKAACGLAGACLPFAALAQPATVAIQAQIDRVMSYPGAALRSNAEGIVQVAFEVGADGRAINARVVKSSGHRVLDRAALGTIGRLADMATDRAGETVYGALQYGVANGSMAEPAQFERRLQLATNAMRSDVQLASLRNAGGTGASTARAR